MIQVSFSCTALLRKQTPRIPQILCRHKSITAAIERGKQNSGEASTFRTRRQEKDDEFQSRAYNLRKRKDALRDLPSSRLRYRPSSVGERAERRVASGSVETLRYTTAASEFLYGYSSVLAAIKANRRKLYKLYVNERGINHTNSRALMARARHAGVDVREVGPHYIAAMENASSGRPNNGFILEASPLPVPPIAELQYVQKSYNTLGLVLDQQSKEDAEVNGTRTEYPFKSAGWRNPLILYVDGVLDEGNLGAIARSAYFLGVDALITPTRQSAPWSHIAVKASAGAAEALPIFKVNQPTDFLGKSARAGWRIYASDAIPATEQRAAPFDDSISTKNIPSNFASSVVYTFARSVRRLPANHSPLESHPTILMMGAEGTGLRTSLLNMAHYKVGIRHGRDIDEVGVDSLNVSVATSLLCYHMLQKPIPTRSPGEYLF